jgi:hypothetical protein
MRIMREDNYLRYFIGFLIAVGLIILLIVLLFTGGGGSSNTKKPKTVMALSDYASTDAVARLTIDGPIVADQNHQAIQITVGQDDVTYSQVQGFQGTVVNQQSFVNNQNAYSNFLYALGHAGFTKGDNSKLLANEKGYCATGSRYIFELINNGTDVQRYWATSCGNSSPKTYKGNLILTLTLFRTQVPGYPDLTQNLTIN